MLSVAFFIVLLSVIKLSVVAPLTTPFFSNGFFLRKVVSIS